METGTTVGWRVGLLAVVVLLGGAAVLRSCGTFDPLPPLPDYKDSLAAAREAFAADSAAWRVERRHLLAAADSALRVSRNAEAEATRLRARRAGQPVRIAYTSDSTPMVPKADFDSLAAEADSLWSVVRADSVALEAQSAQIRADSLAYARLATLRADETRLHERRVADLTTALAKAQRGPRLLGLIPLPSRTTSFILGAVVGVVATRAVR